MAVKINFRPSLRKLSDEELMGRVRQMGDEKAFDELYRRYARRLYGFFFRMLGREGQLASDFTQELFLRVWAVRGGMNADGSYVLGFSRWPIICAGMNIVSGILR